jgi:hypothetical protein
MSVNFAGLHSVAFQQMVLIIVVAVKTSNPTQCSMLVQWSGLVFKIMEDMFIKYCKVKVKVKLNILVLVPDFSHTCIEGIT